MLFHIAMALLLVMLRNHVTMAHEKQRCRSILTPDHDNCENLQDAEHFPKECPQTELCQKWFKFCDIELEPFIHILDKVVVSAIEMCCGHQNCRNSSHFENTTISMRNLSQANLNSSNFVFPILGDHSSNIIYGYHFIPILHLSNGYLITKAKTSTELLHQLTRSCANLWPLLVIIVLMSIIAGFLLWVPETWFNKDEFPRMFFRGLFEGFWWAFISMTTVGYGDKIPKFFLSRLISVIWILIGITICSIFTASLTNEITTASNAPDPSMHGKTIGVFKYRSFDAAFVAKHGGKIKETSGISEIENVREIKNMLSSGSVDGIFMDKFTYMYSVSLAKGSKEREIHHHDVTPEVTLAADFFLRKTHHTEISFEGPEMAYGILVRDEEDYEYFEEFLRHNQIIYETCALLHLNEAESPSEELHLNKDERPSEDLHDIFSTEDKDGPFFDFLYWCLGIIAGICIGGLVFEIARKTKQLMKIKDVSNLDV